MNIFIILLFLIPFELTNAATDLYLKRVGWVYQNGGYKDPKTGIIWGPEVEKMSWGETKTYCESLNIGGRSDWRLPTVMELQRSVCKVTGYRTRVPCPYPRNHKKDLWLLMRDSEKGITYWAGDLIPGDPYNSYYFSFDAEGQHIITSKGDKSKARCVTKGKKKLKEKKETVEDSKFSFYFAPYIGFGAFLTNEVNIDNYLYLNGELRFGFNVRDKLMVTVSGDTGINVRDFDYPLVTTITIGPEYSFHDNISTFANIGVGIITSDTNVLATQPGAIVTETKLGFAWKVGLNWQISKWGNRGQYRFPISISYTGVKTQWVLCHMLLVSTGFMYFN